MKKLYFIVAVTFVCILSSCSKESIEVVDDAVAPIENIANAVNVEAQIMDLVNEHRISLGKNTLAFDNVAYDFANEHTNYMISKGETSHDNFTKRASSMSQKVQASAIAENVASKYDSASEAVENWLASDEHRAAIEGDYTHTAVSVKEDQNGDFYFTQMFYR